MNYLIAETRAKRIATVTGGIAERANKVRDFTRTFTTKR